jgi:hypothetical protein
VEVTAGDFCFQGEGREVRGGSDMRAPLARGRNKMKMENVKGKGYAGLLDGWADSLAGLLCPRLDQLAALFF